MKLALVSDTHGYLGNLVEEIRKQNVNYIFFMGDGVEEADILRDELNIPTFAVAGNNDYFSDAKPELFFVLEKTPIYMTHGHRQSVYYSRSQLASVAESKGAKLVFYGHTHIFRDEWIGDIRLINPGSASFPRDAARSFAVLELPSGILERIYLP